MFHSPLDCSNHLSVHACSYPHRAQRCGFITLIPFIIPLPRFLFACLAFLGFLVEGFPFFIIGPDFANPYFLLSVSGLTDAFFANLRLLFFWESPKLPYHPLPLTASPEIWTFLGLVKLLFLPVCFPSFALLSRVCTDKEGLYAKVKGYKTQDTIVQNMNLV
jgi:hypothetical protein